MVFDGFRVLPEGGGMKPQLLNLWFVAKHLFLRLDQTFQ